MNKKKIVAAGGLVINEKNEILFIFRRQHWDLPKGKLDEGETIEACAVREVQEETGLKKVEIISFLCKTYHEYFDKWVNEDVVKESWWYLMKSSSSEILIPQTEEDIEKIIWVDETVIGFYLNKTYPSITEVYEKYLSKNSDNS
jgi:mutator protein MutT